MYEIPKKLIPDAAKEYRPPRIKLTLQQIKNLSDEELLMLLSGEGQSGVISAPLLQAISYELTSRQLKRSSKPHWTVLPTFYAVIFFGLLTIVIGILSLLK